jgi:hypothetical protein
LKHVPDVFNRRGYGGRGENAACHLFFIFSRVHIHLSTIKKSVIMSVKTVIPRSITKFTEYIRIACERAEKNAGVYGIDPAELAKIKLLHDAYVVLEALCADPETATKAHRDARNIARQSLEKYWRIFLNREIRYNDAVSIADKEIFGILPHDETPTPAAAPKETGMVAAVRVGYCAFDAVVEESATGRKKRPVDAAGSNLYSAVVEPGEPAPHRNTFRFEGFSSTCHHKLHFSEAYFLKQIYLFARYTSRHGQEGTDGPLASVIVT